MMQIQGFPELIAAVTAANTGIGNFTTLTVTGATALQGGATITGNSTVTGTLTANSFIPTSSSVPTNGLYLSAANTPSIAANGLNVMDFVSVASANRRFIVTNSNGGNPTLGTSGGDLLLAPNGGSLAITGGISATGAMNLRNATAVVAGGQSQALFTSSGIGIYVGSGAPSASAAKGSLYLRSDGSTTNDRMYVNTNGSTTWTACITAA